LEAFLLELLSDFQVTVPELGTIRAEHVPIVILTSNRTREIHDALKRRCLYFFIDHPDMEREIEIVRLRVPDAEERLARQVARAVQRLRAMDLYKPPGVAETLDWTEALVALGAKELDEALIEATMGSVLKYHEDQQRVLVQSLNLLAGA
jgi:MoxR-like ATPase